MRKLLVAWCSILLIACGAAEPLRPPAPEVPDPDRTAQLHILNWDTYIDPDLISQFEAAHGVQVVYDTFGVNDELYERMRESGFEYDIVVPSDYLVAILRREGLLKRLDPSQLPNLANVDPLFRNPLYDPGMRYCIPYQWGTQGIGYRAAQPATTPDWYDLFHPPADQKIALLNDPRSTIGAALIALGYSPNSLNQQEIGAARDLIIANIDQIIFSDDEGQDLLRSGEVAFALEWSGDIFQLMNDDPTIAYALPPDGSIIWTDNLCIPATAPNPELAHAFMNFILTAEIGAQLSNYIRYSTPNQAALPLINPHDRENALLYPDEETRQHLFFIVDVGSDGLALYEAAWQQILAARDS